MIENNFVLFEGIEIMLVSGGSGTSLAMDDLARTLGLLYATDLDPIVAELKLSDERYRHRIVPRGRIEMISLAAAIKIAEALDSREGQPLVKFLRTETPMSEFDRIRYNDLAPEAVNNLRIRQAVSRLLETYPNATTEFVAERIDISRGLAAYFVRYVRTFENFAGVRTASQAPAITPPAPPQQMSD